LLRWDSGRHGLAGRCCGCTQGSCNLDGVRIQRVVGTLNAITGRKEGVESLDEIWITSEECGDAINDARSIDATISEVAGVRYL
jgi:hypothetical protein